MVLTSEFLYGCHVFLTQIFFVFSVFLYLGELCLVMSASIVLEQVDDDSIYWDGDHRCLNTNDYLRKV